MKVCPVCDALAFDDAETCFGCLHDYREDARGVAVHPARDVALESKEEKVIASPVESSRFPGFLIRFVPEADSSGAVTWSCSVEMAAC